MEETKINEVEKREIDTKNESESRELATKKRRITLGILIKPAIFSLIFLGILSFVLGGFVFTSFEHASFYFNALRSYEDRDMSKVGYTTMDAYKSTLYKDKEMRYFDQVQPGTLKQTNSMHGSWYILPYPEAFPIQNKLQFRAYKSDEMVKLDVAHAENRFKILKNMDKKKFHSWIVDQPVTKIKPFGTLSSADLQSSIAELDPWVSELVNLAQKVIKEFSQKYRTSNFNSETDQEYYVKMNDKKEIELSSELEKGILAILEKLPHDSKLANNGKDKVTIEHVKGWFKRLGYANPTLVDSVVLGRVYFWAAIHSLEVKEDEFEKKVEDFKKKVEAKKEAEKSFREQNKNAKDEDVAKAMEKFAEEIGFMRTMFIYRGISTIFSHLFLSKKRTQYQKFPFNKQGDSRNVFSRFFGIAPSNESSKKIAQILEAMTGEEYPAK
ncbi:hypothetical protein ECANGB1_1461 [Enterospora canceri]|uniref:Uncharacterized protein n=1 Tax=Enterospora canceri TaxID=1081671 RepID=A0A1Y1S5Z6_9MICR|nr:hypothetical protein ECANGB1_1461 [Enterospora canceri]